ncbi:hypothetical protein LXL04_037935 [Taraxacum kok-saghyz]
MAKVLTSLLNSIRFCFAFVCTVELNLCKWLCTQQKIVVKITMHNEKKIRKALKIAVSLSGVESASFVGSDKTQIAVTGEDVDSVELVTLLRKGVGYTELVSVGPVEEKKPAAAKETKPMVAPLYVNPYQLDPFVEGVSYNISVNIFINKDPPFKPPRFKKSSNCCPF